MIGVAMSDEASDSGTEGASAPQGRWKRFLAWRKKDRLKEAEIIKSFRESEIKDQGAVLRERSSL